MSSAKTRLRWQWGRWRRLLGWPGVAGAAMLLLALLAYIAIVIPERLQAEGMRQQVANLEAAARSGTLVQEQGPEATLAAFYESFPGRGTASSWLEKIYAAGSAQGLVLDKGEYRLSSGSNRLARYEINLPVRGSYVQVRRFIDTVLTEVPSIALNDIQFRRGTIKESQVEARIRFVLYLREAG